MDEWTRGNGFELLENGEAFFPRVLEAIDAAKRDVVLETYIFCEDDVGQALAGALIRAARRQVRVTLTIDGYGSAELSQLFLERLAHAGVAVRWFDSQPTLLRVRTNVFCRLHRKLAVVDHRIAFVGGINMSAQHLRRFGGESMQDYAVRVSGPVVQDILACTRGLDEHSHPSPWGRWRHRIGRVPRALRQPQLGGQALFVARDNRKRSTDIETMYRVGIRNAKRQIIIASAYFFPGYRLLRDLARAARRGVEVKLVLQGRPDVPISAAVGAVLYDYLLAAGVRIFHYKERALHAKVAVIDANWTTVGSSNLDPISLGLNLEANLFALDEGLAEDLRHSLDALMNEACEEVTARVPERSLARRLLLMLIYYGTRHMPHWGRFVLRRSQFVQAV